MRITNSMISNNTLLNINRNMRYLSKITQQIESMKKINVPSDDPIIASRALKFRTSVSETQQFTRNLNSGMSWMEVSEAALIDVNENLMVRFKDLFTEGATGTEEYADKMTIIAELRELVDQMGMDMNQTYAGRYVFAGYRTDEPPVLIEDDAEKSFRIEQNFLIGDIEKVKSYEKYDSVKEADVVDGNDGAFVLKLAYKPEAVAGANPGDPETFPGTVLDANGDPMTVVIKHLNRSINDNGTADTADDFSDAYLPQGNPDDDNPPTVPPTVHYIPETGELVFHPDAAANTVIFDNPATAEHEGVTVIYDKTGFKKGELNPVTYFKCTDLEANPDVKLEAYEDHVPQYTMDTQEIQYEFATNTYITVNSLAKDIYTDKMYTDFRRLIEFADSLKISERETLEQYYSTRSVNPLSGNELTEAVNKHLSDETALLNSVLHDRFNNMLGLLDKHAATATEGHTQMGSRMLRLDLLRVRLEEDEGAYTKLMSENEDTKLEYAIMLKANAETAYKASLRANANIMQLSLANFI